MSSSSLTEINLFSFSEDLPFCARLVQVFLVLAQKAKSKENKFIFSPSPKDTHKNSTKIN